MYPVEQQAYYHLHVSKKIALRRHLPTPFTQGHASLKRDILVVGNRGACNSIAQKIPFHFLGIVNLI